MLKFTCLNITAMALLTVALPAYAAKPKVVEITFDESDAKSKTVTHLTPEQIAEGGQLAADARHATRVSNDLNSDIPDDTILDELVDEELAN